MRIQDTNQLMNEARIQRRAHANETGEFEEGTRRQQRINRVRNVVKQPRIKYGLAGLLAAAVATTTVLLLRSRRNRDFSF